MSTETQRIENAEKVALAIKLATKGEPHAEHYLRTIAGAARILDDVVDGDHAVVGQDIVVIFTGVLVGLQGNPFFVRNREFLTAYHQMILNAWLDANEWEKSEDRTRRIYAHVLRDLINELLPAVAYLGSGWAYMREVSPRIRELFTKEIN